MPAQIFIQPTQGQSMVAGAQAVSQGLQSAIGRWQEEEKKRRFNEGMFEVLSTQTDSSGQPYVPVKAIERWQSMSPDKQAGVLSLAAARYKEDAQRRSQEQEMLTLSAEEIARAKEAGAVPLRQSRGSFQYLKTGGPGGAGELPQPGTAVLDDAGNQIGVWDAKGKISKVSAKSGGGMGDINDLKRSQIDAQIAALRGELAQGNKKTGPDWNPLATDYEAQITGLEEQRRALGGDGSQKTSNVQRRTSNVEQKQVPAGTPRISTAEEHAALAPGAVYIDARDGKTKRKKS